jgi:RNA polymerase sigma factor (sigma-70 family)
MMAKVIPMRVMNDELAGCRSDAEIVKRCAAGDRMAMGELFDRHGPHVQRFLARLAGGGTDVDDLVHATFLEALRSVRRFRGGAQVRTWLFGIAINISRHHLRSEVRRRAFLTVWAERPEERSARPDQLVERQQLVGRLAEALVDLPHDLRAAYLLCEVEGLKGPEAAAALGVRPGTLGRRLHEARKALRIAIERGRP